jgi:hypothetical protein
MKHKVTYTFEAIVESKSKREAKKIVKQMMRDGKLEPKCSCVPVEQEK